MSESDKHYEPLYDWLFNAYTKKTDLSKFKSKYLKEVYQYITDAYKKTGDEAFLNFAKRLNKNIEKSIDQEDKNLDNIVAGIGALTGAALYGHKANKEMKKLR